MKFNILTASLLAGTALAGPTPSPIARRGEAADQILKIAPKSATCKDPKECRTAAQAEPFLITAMQTWEVYSPGEIAAVLALMAFESVEFQYKHNVSPGRPGQGTANMQMPEFNLEYAKAIPALKDKVAALGDAKTDEQKNQLLALVTDDKYNFGSGPWFLATKCKDARPELAKGTDAGFAAYMKCVGVEVNADRTAYWTRAKEAFGIKSS